MNNPIANPVQQRIVALDVLRGFALFGVLLVNILDFSGSTLRADTLGIRGSAFDQVVDISIAFFAITKFYLLFSFLFGAGFAVQMRRMSSSGRAFTTFYLRRLLVLLLIGFVHSILLWDGDILRLYAVAGVLLLLVRNWPTRRLLVLAGLIALSGLLIFSLLPYDAISTMANRQEVQLFSSGSWEQLAVQRLKNQFVLDIQIPMVLVMFLLGLVVGRSGTLDEPQRYRPFLHRWWKRVLPLALAGNALFLAGFETKTMWMVSLGIHVGAPLLSFVYAALVLLYTEKLAFMAPTGQMALTNYLTQSLLATTVFYGYGFGLYDRLPPTLILLLVLLVYAAQLLASRLWLTRFRFGPMEWLWRSLSYGRWQNLLR